MDFRLCGMVVLSSNLTSKGTHEMKANPRDGQTVGVVIFSGFNPRAVLAFLRTLVKTNVRFGIVASSETDEIFRTDYKDYVTAVRSQESLVKNDIERCICLTRKRLNCEILVIAPSTEFLNRFMLNEQAFFSSIRVQVPLVDRNIYELVSDKKSFGDLCLNYGLKIPEEFDSVDKAFLPFVAKPISYKSKNGNINAPVLIKNKEEMEFFFEKFNHSEFYYQKFISGESYYLLYYFSRSGAVDRLSMKNILQQPEGKSIIASELSDVHLTPISDQYEKLFMDLNFIGLVMVELRKHNDDFYMIEANPRFWGPSQIFVDANLNLFAAFLNDWIGPVCAVADGSFISSAKYFWMAGLLEQGSPLDCACHVGDDDAVKILGRLGEFVSSDIYMRPDSIEIGLDVWRKVK